MVKTKRTPLDWLIVIGATAILAAFAAIARAPQIPVHWGWVAALALAMLGMLAGCGVVLWRTTRFS